MLIPILEACFMFTVISVYNNKEIFEKCLLSSLNKQLSEFETIFIDNTHNVYQSAAKAFNEAIEKANGKYIIFAHQDIIIEDPEWMIKVQEVLDSLENIGVVGVAGCKENEKGVYTNIRHGSDKRYAGDYRVNKPIEVQTVDECLFIIPKDVLKKIQFDEATCYNWHFYAADFCLQSALEGYKVYVIPSDIYHLSPGNSLNLDYYKTAKRLYKKYKKSYKIINTTCSRWETKKFLVQYFYRVSKHIIKKFLIKHPCRVSKYIIKIIVRNK
jgi:GT2 family glycosyltransferase